MGLFDDIINEIKDMPSGKCVVCGTDTEDRYRNKYGEFIFIDWGCKEGHFKKYGFEWYHRQS